MAYPAKTDRARILTAALEEVESAGVENLAIRSVAARLGLAPNALYRYFDSLAALKAALAEEVRLRMLDLMQEAVAGKGPAESIYAIAETYLRFAREQPRAFALYMKTQGGPSTPQCARNTAFFVEHVTRVYGERRAYEASHALWAMLQGMAVLGEANLVSAEQSSTGLRLGLKMWIDGAASDGERA